MKTMFQCLPIPKGHIASLIINILFTETYPLQRSANYKMDFN